MWAASKDTHPSAVSAQPRTQLDSVSSEQSGRKGHTQSLTLPSSPFLTSPPILFKCYIWVVINLGPTKQEGMVVVINTKQNNKKKNKMKKHTHKN